MIRNSNVIEQLTTLSLQDGQSIKKLLSILGSKPPTHTQQELSQLLDSSYLSIFVIRSSDKIIGMVSLVIIQTLYVKKALLEDFVIDSNYQGQGLGTALLQKVITVAKKKKVTYIDLTSRPDRIGANALYKKFGFEKRETNVYRLTLDDPKT